MSNQPEKFCKAPFKTAVINTDGSLLPCCEFMSHKSKLTPYKLNKNDTWMFKQWWKKGLDPLREKMLNGEIDPGCTYCIRKEKNRNQPNLRLGTNANISDTFEKIKQDYEKDKREHPKQVELRLGNYCNLKCTMCGPYASSSILAEYKMHQKQFNDYGIHSTWDDPNTPDDWYTYDHNKKIILDVISNASRIHFGGGEPFISPMIVEVLNSIKSNTYLRFNTNMTRINDKVLNVLKKFDRIEIEASIDGTGPHNDYIRYGSKWNSIVENFKKLNTCNNISVKIYYLLGHTSLFTLKNVISFAKDIDIDIVFGEVYYGSVDDSGHLTINSALEQDVNNLKIWLNSQRFNNRTAVKTWLNNYKPNPTLHNRFKDYFKMLDSIRGTNFVKTFNPSWT